MEFLVPTGLHKVPHSSALYPLSAKSSFSSHTYNGIKFRRRFSSSWRPLGVPLCSEKVSTPTGNPFLEKQEEAGNDSEFVEVVGIGGRKEAVLDFCLDSPLLSSSLRFWNILIEDSVKVQLQQRFTGEDVTIRVVEALPFLQSCSKAVILVATAAYGSDHIRVLDFLKRVKSGNALVVGIILKPFSFEGRRRRDEVKDLLQKLEDHANFCIVVDADVLLEKDLVTLDEALKTANTALLMALNAVAVLVSESEKKLLHFPENNVKELEISEVKKIIESYKEAKIGFGAGYNIKTSIMRATRDCPFLSDMKDLDGTVICILASSAVIESSDVVAFLHTFRQITECSSGIILSTVQESNLEPNLIMSTVITVGHVRGQAPQGISIFSRLVQRFPLIFNLLKRPGSQSQEAQESYLAGGLLSEVMDSSESGDTPNMKTADRMLEGLDIYSAEIQTQLENKNDELWRSYGSRSSEQDEVDFLETMADTSKLYDSDEGRPAFERESLIRQNLGPEYWNSQEWATDHGATQTLDNISTYKLPIGVKPLEELENGISISTTVHHQESITENDVKAQVQVTSRMSLDALTDTSFVTEFYDGASALLKGSNTNASKKQGVLSVRAASMLESERDSQKKWNRIVEIKYRGGIYKGRCQGGLPEGKGRLSLRDGSIYDGMWRYGKRSGLGTFYFSNGDVFQGSWRDDMMHGKGWLYFHTGDRWFANFWKGKANGEGRFYSKLGEIFFGHFEDGWRHGHFLCINVEGGRFIELWDEGVLVSRKPLEADTSSE